jgi:glycosyltransferase involved in cell wall biosynthesis
MKTTSSLAIIVISKGRPAVLKETLEGFPLQTMKASQIIVVVTCDADLPPEDRPDFIEFYISKPGICRQRNLGLEKIRSDIDYVAFFDDDFELRADYLENAANFLDSCPAIVGFSGNVLCQRGGTRAQAKKRIEDYHPVETYKGNFIRDVKYAILFGCCMIIRKSVMVHEKFDEDLPLYAFGEDYDISMRLRRYGIIGRFEECVGVHLESPGGRVNEVQRGYSMIANNWYFMRKGVCHLPPFPAMLRFWFVVVIKLLVQALWRAMKGDKSSDWAGRAKGFCLAVADIFRGRSSPARMLDFSK